MENNIPIHLQEIIFATSDIALNRQLSKLEEEGQIKKLHHVSILLTSMKQKK